MGRSGNSPKQGPVASRRPVRNRPATAPRGHDPIRSAPVMIAISPRDSTVGNQAILKRAFAPGEAFPDNREFLENLAGFWPLGVVLGARSCSVLRSSHCAFKLRLIISFYFWLSTPISRNRG